MMADSKQTKREDNNSVKSSSQPTSNKDNREAILERAQQVPGSSKRSIRAAEEKLLHRDPNQPIRAYVDMVGDLFHAGHVAFIKNVRDMVKREFGNDHIYVMVGITNDKDVIPYKRKPISSMEERITSISACR